MTSAPVPLGCGNWRAPKPRLYYRGGWWFCCTSVPFYGCGAGSTPRAAYLDWQYS